MFPTVRSYEHVVVSTSAGKDSQAALDDGRTGPRPKGHPRLSRPQPESQRRDRPGAGLFAFILRRKAALVSGSSRSLGGLPTVDQQTLASPILHCRAPVREVPPIPTTSEEITKLNYVEEPRIAAPLVIIPCSSTKADRRSPAAELYTGSYHMACRRAALALSPPDRVLILSARYGLLNLTDPRPLEPYDERIPVNQRRSARSEPPSHVGLAVEYARTNGLLADTPVVLAGRAYSRVCIAVWGGRVILPLASTRGIGEQMAVLRAIATSGELPTSTVARKPVAGKAGGTRNPALLGGTSISRVVLGGP